MAALRSLHVACMPFPTHQGTQALVRMMLEALSAAGHDAHLVVYAHGQPLGDAPFTVHRLHDSPRVTSERSGPSLGKVALDAQMIFAVRGLVKRLRPDIVVAHNVEAAAAVRASGVRPFVYFAHTSFREELPFYASRGRPALRHVGWALDQLAMGAASRTVAVSPALADTLGDAVPLAIPWSPAARPADARRQRQRVRTRLGIGDTERAVLYAGNLDAYQGWEMLARALPPEVHWLVATGSDPAPLLALGRPGTHLLPCDGEAARWDAHLAADATVIPRAALGGLPVKLLDALGRGLPVVASARACAGLALESTVEVVPDALTAATLREAIERSLMDSDRPARGVTYLRTHHAPEHFASRFAALSRRGGI